MKTKRKDVLAVALLGMDERTSKLMGLFFKGPCEGFAEVVDEADARIDVIDTHFANSEQLIAISLARTPARCIIVLTSKKEDRLKQDNLLYLDKPIKAEQMMEALDWANDISKGQARLKPYFEPPRLSAFANPSPQPESTEQPKPAAPRTTDVTQPEQTVKTSAEENIQAKLAAEREQQKQIDLAEQRKKAKYRSAISVEEQDFDSFVGTVPDIDVNDNNWRYRAAYLPKNHYQGYLEVAYKACLAKKQTLQLNCTIWTPLIILPHSNEVWLDADDVLLKNMASVWLDGRNISVTPVQKETLQKMADVEKIQEMNAFMWKLAIWTSKGRYPKSLDVDTPITLKHWPDFTRYIVTPHALRISGLLIGRGPETMAEIAGLLNIELRYVYVFISAAHALGIAIQAKRQADTIIKTTLPATEPVKKGLLNRIISTLRGK